MRKDHPELAGWWWIFGWAWSEGFTPRHPPGYPIMLESFCFDSESSRVWNVPSSKQYLKRYKTTVLPLSADPPSPGLQGGFLGSTWRSLCSLSPRGRALEVFDVQSDCGGWDRNLTPKRRHGMFCECV